MNLSIHFREQYINKNVQYIAFKLAKVQKEDELGNIEPVNTAIKSSNSCTLILEFL